MFAGHLSSLNTRCKYGIRSSCSNVFFSPILSGQVGSFKARHTPPGFALILQNFFSFQPEKHVQYELLGVCFWWRTQLTAKLPKNNTQDCFTFSFCRSSETKSTTFFKYFPTSSPFFGKKRTDLPDKCNLMKILSRNVVAFLQKNISSYLLNYVCRTYNIYFVFTVWHTALEICYDVEDGIIPRENIVSRYRERWKKSTIPLEDLKALGDDAKYTQNKNQQYRTWKIIKRNFCRTTPTSKRRSWEKSIFAAKTVAAVSFIVAVGGFYYQHSVTLNCSPTQTTPKSSPRLQSSRRQKGGGWLGLAVGMLEKYKTQKREKSIFVGDFFPNVLSLTHAIIPRISSVSPLNCAHKIAAPVLIAADSSSLCVSSVEKIVCVLQIILNDTGGIKQFDESIALDIYITNYPRENPDLTLSLSHLTLVVRKGGGSFKWTPYSQNVR